MKKLITLMWAGMLVGAYLASVSATDGRESANLADFSHETIEEDNFTAEETEAVKEPFLSVTEQFDFSWMDEDLHDGVDEPETWPEIEPSIVEPETEPETVIVETEPETAPETITIYSLDGDVIDHEIALYIWECLDDYGMTWFYEPFLCIAYQESSWRPDCVTGPDKGFLQYREHYWDEWCSGAGERGDIFDTKMQIRVTCYWSAKRFAKGESLEEVISDHKSGGGWYDAAYVKSVMDWMPKLIKKGEITR